MKASPGVLGERAMSRAKVRGNQPERHQHSTVLGRVSTAGLVVSLALLMFATLASVRPAWCEILSVSTAGDQGNGASGRCAISGDGNIVVFESDASNLVPNDTESGSWDPGARRFTGFTDIFMRNRSAATTTLVSIDTSGVGFADGASFIGSLSQDGMYIAFHSWAWNLRADGNAKDQYDRTADVYVRDLNRGATFLASVSTSGGFELYEHPDETTQWCDSFYPSIAAPSNGDIRVAFCTDANNVINAGEDTNRKVDVFLHSRPRNW